MVYKDVPCGWEHPHELLERLERLTNVELNVHLIEILEVCGKRCEVEGIIPLPRGRLVTHALYRELLRHTQESRTP